MNLLELPFLFAPDSGAGSSIAPPVESSSGESVATNEEKLAAAVVETGVVAIDIAVRPELTARAEALRWIQEYVRRRDGGGSGRSAGDLPMSELRSRIARHHAPLVESVARRFAGTGESVDDLVQEGFLGLLSALESFDPDKKVKFSTYATHFIAGTIRHFLRDHSRTIREPAWLQEMSARIEKTAASLSAQYERAAEPAEIARVLSVNETTVSEVIAARAALQLVPLGAPGVEAGEVIDAEHIASPGAPAIARLVENRLLLEKLMGRLKQLEQQVIYEFYFRDLSQAEIARKLGISGNYVSVTLKQALNKLRKLLTEADVLDRGRGTESSIVEPVTGLYTAIHVRARLEESLSHAQRAQSELAVLLLHAARPNLALHSARKPIDDSVWQACGQRLRRAIRRMDLVGRYKNDTFLLVLPDTGPQVEAVHRRLIPLLHATAQESGETLEFTPGGAWFPENGRSATSLLELAEKSLAETLSAETIDRKLAA